MCKNSKYKSEKNISNFNLRTDKIKMKVLIVFVICVANVYGKVTPDYFPQCKRSDPQLDKCVLNGVEGMRPRLLVGIPELNIPSLEPFVVPSLKLDRTAPNLRLKANIKNMVAHGGGKFRIEKLRIDLKDKYAAEMKLILPKLDVTADYDVRGSKLLAIDINGKGKLQSSFTGITAIVKALAKVVEKDGIEFLQADKVTIKMRINNGQVQFSETERPLAAASAAAFFNGNPRVVLDILNPLIEESGAAITKSFLNKILGNIPLKDVLEDA